MLVDMGVAGLKERGRTKDEITYVYYSPGNRYRPELLAGSCTEKDYQGEVS